MNIYTLRRSIDTFFNGEAQVYIISQNKIEVDASKNLSKEDWKRCAESLGLEDNSSRIPDSWKYNDITVVFFCGSLQRFTKKNTFNIGF